MSQNAEYGNGAPKIIDFEALCLWRTFRFLFGFSALAPVVWDCWRSQDLVKIGHTLQTGS